LIHEAAELLDGVLGGGPHCAPPRDGRAGSSRDRRERAGSTQLEGRLEFLVAGGLWAPTAALVYARQSQHAGSRLSR
jgi:hypothetical protein